MSSVIQYRMRITSLILSALLCLLPRYSSCSVRDGDRHFVSFRGVEVSAPLSLRTAPKDTPTSRMLVTDECHKIANKIVRLYMKAEYERDAQSTRVLTLDEYATKYWPSMIGALREAEDGYRRALPLMEEYAHVSATVSARQFWQQRRKADANSDLPDEDEWLSIVRIFRHPAALRRAIDDMPKGPEAAYSSSLGRDADYEEYLERWTVSQLREQDPSLLSEIESSCATGESPVIGTTETARSEMCTTGSMSSLSGESSVAAAMAKQVLLSEVRRQLVLNRVMNELQFSSDAFRDQFLQYCRGVRAHRVGSRRGRVVRESERQRVNSQGAKQ